MYKRGTHSNHMNTKSHNVHTYVAIMATQFITKIMIVTVRLSRFPPVCTLNRKCCRNAPGREITD